ncbi:uncharacterized protein [Amphiura filiformis]|uniref:uncharacterized protein n=1 Tax=Amphiura filiformis TaxID=82378 RepID=UPI003B2188CA
MKLQNKFDLLKDEAEDLDVIDVCERLTNTILDCALETAGKKDPQKIDKISKETFEMMKKRREMKNTIGIHHIEYTELCKTIRKRMTNEIRAHNTKMIQKTLEDNKSYKKTKQGLATGKSQIIALKGEDGNIISDRELVIKRVEEFYQDLYSSKVQITPPIIDVESAEENIHQLERMKLTNVSMT